MKKYSFEDVDCCEMCGDRTKNHRVLGQRLNSSQGLSPKKKQGISVSVKECNSCGLIYSSPIPVPFNILDHYGSPPQEYWKPSYFEWQEGYFSRQINFVKGLLRFKAGMKALDIGAGLGKAMISMDKAGFDTYGFEPSVPFYERAISKMQISPTKIRNEMVENIEYPKNEFDFITYGAVFEHLYHPAQTLERTMKWLKPGGIVHIEVPSSKHFIAKLVNIYYRLIGTNYVTNISPMHTPFHLYEFSLESFEKLKEKLNFTIERHYFDVCEIYFIPKFLHPILRLYMKWTKTGMQLTVYLRKK